MKKSLKSYAASAAVALSLTLPASADVFLLLSDIPGDSLNASYKDHIDVLAWSWGLSNSSTTHVSSGFGDGKASFQDISLTKFIDKASPKLITRIANGVHIKEGTLFVTADVGQATQVLVTELKLEDIIVSSLSVSSSSNDQPAENTTLNFSKFTITNNTIKPDGSLTKGIPFCWDIAANEQC